MNMLKFKSLLLSCPKSSQDDETKNLAQKYQISPNNLLDYFEISPLRKQVSIDQVRELKRHIWQKPQKAPVKFVVIKEADLLTHEAQNALLKLLEEPPSHAIIVLATDRKQKLLPTIRSRTIEINIRPQKKPALLDSKFPIDNFEQALTVFSQIENPKEWIDRQIENSYQKLLTEVGHNNPNKIKSIVKNIEDLSYSKKLIEANVSPKFALFNLALSALF